ncbi:MAG: peptidyl-alpha-hydroxyglycine alpha-amidating lyase family protein [Dehalococcoidales bacterium]|jgi:DNA-binding beta-propeller fold protein YncE
MSYGKGKYTYELAKWQAKYQEGHTPIEVNSICIDAKDRLYAFNTGDQPVTVFDREGNLVKSWGDNLIGHSHGTFVGPDGSIYCADDGNHTVSKFSADGKVLLTLGTKDKPSDTGFSWVTETGARRDFMEALTSTKRGGPPFNAPTGVALNAKGEIFVADGYGNARVHKFSPEGKLLLSWGEPGKGPGQFIVPHSVAIDKKGRVLVADRHNNRIQIFDQNGKYLTEWGGLNLPTSLYIDKDDTVYVAELMPRVTILDNEGKVLAQWGNEGRTKEDPLFVALHSVVADSKGDLYVAEVMGIFKDNPFLATRTTRMIQKFTRK